MLVRLICWLLKSSFLSPEKRVMLTNQVLSTIGALPLHAIITVDDAGKLHISGVPLEYEKAVSLRESASNVLNSDAWKIVHDQVLYLAVSKGVHEALNHDQILFAKAAIWYGQQERDVLKVLAGETGNSRLSGD